jgi:hypothetical protein
VTGTPFHRCVMNLDADLAVACDLLRMARLATPEALT